MFVTQETIHKEISRDNYWTRVHFESEVDARKSVVLICASHEYLWDKLGVRDLGDQEVKDWMDKIIKEWEAKGEKIFNQNSHMSVYAVTEEGQKNGLEFLQTKVNA